MLRSPLAEEWLANLPNSDLPAAPVRNSNLRRLPRKEGNLRTAISNDSLASSDLGPDFLHLPDIFYDDDLHTQLLLGDESERGRGSDNDVASLIDFLRNHPPPEDSTKSRPSSPRNKRENRRWSKLMSKGERSKSFGQACQNFRLPDSTVWGITSAGHRHIAISIPQEVSPLAYELGSQPSADCPYRGHFPVKDPIDAAFSSPSHERGLAKILRYVTDIHGKPLQSSPALSSSSLLPFARRQPLMDEQLGSSPSLTTEANSSVSWDQDEYVLTLPTQLNTPLLDDSLAPWNRSSLDGWDLSRHNSFSLPKALEGESRSVGVGAEDGLTYPSYPKVRQSVEYEDPPKEAAVSPAQSSPHPDGDVDHYSKGGPVMSPHFDGEHACATQAGWDGAWKRRTQLLSKQVASKLTISPPAGPDSIQSRKRMVHDKKRRDLEAARQAKLRAQSEQAAAEAAAAQGRPTMSNVMVVLDWEPTPDGGSGA